MEKDEKFLLIKYGRIAGVGDCIERHLKVLNEKGYCWFGKIGTAPVVSCIKEKIGDLPIKVLLYSQGKVHICTCEEIVSIKPDEGYPSYYDTYLINRGMAPSIYFKLTSITEYPSDEFAKCASLSSGRKLSETVYRSMASFFYGVYTSKLVLCDAGDIKEKKPVERPKKKAHEKKGKAVKLDMNSCKYRENGLCRCKSSINYSYECDRPSNCLKQKPLPME